MASHGERRYPCAVCGDPYTLEAPDYVDLAISVPGSDSRQWLGAHATCLNRFMLHAPIEIARDH